MNATSAWGVDLVGVRPGDVVRATLDRDQRAVLDQVEQPLSGCLKGCDPVRGAMYDQRGHVELGHVGAEVGDPRVDARVGRERSGARSDVEARVPGFVAAPRPGERVDV
jgi:hypothetical protein